MIAVSFSNFQSFLPRSWDCIPSFSGICLVVLLVIPRKHQGISRLYLWWFHKWGYPEIIHFCLGFSLVNQLLGYPHLWNPPYYIPNKRSVLLSTSTSADCCLDWSIQALEGLNPETTLVWSPDEALARTGYPLGNEHSLWDIFHLWMIYLLKMVIFYRYACLHGGYGLSDFLLPKTASYPVVNHHIHDSINLNI